MKTNKKIEYSLEHKQYLKKIQTKKYAILFTQLGIIIALIGLWELFTKIGVLDVFFFSSPSRIIAQIGALYSGGTLFVHIGTTLYEALIAFVVSVGIGFVVAVLLWWSEYLRRVLEPYLVVLNSLPKIALGPIIIIWFGTGAKAIIIIAFLIMIVITIMDLLASFTSVDKEKILLLKSLGATKWQVLTKLVLPNSLKDFISVLKINVGMTWVGVIMGEYLVSRAGLGYLIVYGSAVFNLDLVMCCIVLLCILSAVLYFIVAFIEKHVRNY